MTRHVALFRGINVGGHNRVPMDELRETFEELGYEQVSSIIQSGNVCFDSDDAPESIQVAIRAAVAERFDVDVPVLLRTEREIAGVLEAHPFLPGEIEPKLHHIMFLTDPAPPDAAMRIGDHPPDEFVVIGAEIHVRYPEGSARSKLTATLIDRQLGTTATARNIPTIEKIAAEFKRAG